MCGECAAPRHWPAELRHGEPAAICARVSTADQSTQMQVSVLRDYVENRNWNLVSKYVDERVSGTKDRRPALDRLMADAKQRRFDAVLVSKLDRFARSLRHLINALAELEALGVAFVSLRDNVDLSTPSGRLMVQIIGAMAEFERSLIVERVRAGLQNARRRGKRLGRRRALVKRPRSLSDGLTGALRPGNREGRGRLGGNGAADLAIRSKEHLE